MRHTLAVHSAPLHSTLSHTRRVSIYNRRFQSLFVCENTPSLFDGQLTCVLRRVRMLYGEGNFLYAVVPRVLSTLLQAGHFFSGVDIDL